LYKKTFDLTPKGLVEMLVRALVLVASAIEDAHYILALLDCQLLFRAPFKFRPVTKAGDYTEPVCQQTSR